MVLTKIIGSNIILNFDETKIVVQQFKSSNLFARPDVSTIPIQRISYVSFKSSIRWISKGNIKLHIFGSQDIEFLFMYKYENEVKELVNLINSKLLKHGVKNYV